jgi:hypothetical protein
VVTIENGRQVRRCSSTVASKGLSQDASALEVPFDVESVGLETPEHVFDRPDQRPCAHPLWRHVKLCSKPIDELVNDSPVQPFRHNGSQEVGGVEGRFAGEGLGSIRSQGSRRAARMFQRW